MSSRAIGAVLRGRRAAEKLMIDKCRIYQVVKDGVGPDGKPIFREINVYEGKCKVQSNTALGLNPKSGEHAFVVERKELHIPAATPGTRSGLMAVLTESVLQPNLVGEIYKLQEPLEKSFQTAQRWVVERLAK